MNTYQKFFKLSIILISLAFLIAACGGEQEPAEQEPAEPESAEQAEPAEEAVASEPDTPTPEPDTPTPEPDTPTPEPEPPTSEPEPPTSEPESTWQEFSPASNAFSVLLPDTPEESTQETTTALGSVPMTLYTVENISSTGDPHYYVVMHAEVPLVVEMMTEEQIEQTILGGQEGMINSMGATLVSEEEITVEGYPGREIELAIEQGKFLAQIMLIENNLYQLMVGVEKGVEFSEEDRQFFDSFKPMIADTAAVESDPVDAETEPSAEQTGSTGDQFAVGEAIDLGDDMTITVNGLVPYEGDVTFLPPEEGFEYVSVEITVDNAGTDTGYFVPFDRAYLMDESSQTYAYDLGASALITDEQNFESEIAAGQQSNGMISFQAPENAEILTLVLDTTAFADGGEVSVPLK